MAFQPTMAVVDIGLENTTGDYRLVIARTGAGGTILSRRDAPGVWTPSVDLRHGTARARLHVILALSWRPDIQGEADQQEAA